MRSGDLVRICAFSSPRTSAQWVRAKCAVQASFTCKRACDRAEDALGPRTHACPRILTHKARFFLRILDAPAAVAGVQIDGGGHEVPEPRSLLGLELLGQVRSGRVEHRPRCAPEHARARRAVGRVELGLRAIVLERARARDVTTPARRTRGAMCEQACWRARSHARPPVMGPSARASGGSGHIQQRSRFSPPDGPDRRPCHSHRRPRWPARPRPPPLPRGAAVDPCLRPLARRAHPSASPSKRSSCRGKEANEG